MNLIEFLMKNIYIVFIILFALSRLFKSSGGQKRPPGRMPDFSGDMNNNREQQGHSSSQPESVEVGRTVPQMMLSDEEDEESQGVYRSHLQPMARHKREAIKESSPFGMGNDSGVSRTSAELKRSRSHRNRFANPSTDNLKQAVVWSEVLGPPRSKRSIRN